MKDVLKFSEECDAFLKSLRKFLEDEDTLTRLEPDERYAVALYCLGEELSKILAEISTSQKHYEVGLHMFVQSALRLRKAFTKEEDECRIKKTQ